MTENREGVCTFRDVLAMAGVGGISFEAASMFVVASLLIARNNLRFMGGLGPYLQDLGLHTVTIGCFSLTPREQIALPVALASGIVIVLMRRLAAQIAEDAQAGKLGGDKELFSISDLLHL